MSVESIYAPECLDEVRAWAAEIVADLPPFTSDELAALGRIAARLDEQRQRATHPRASCAEVGSRSS